MRIIVLFITVISCFCWSVVLAQSLPNISTPKEELSQYQKLHSTYLIKNTKYYNLIGNVQTVNEIIVRKSSLNKPAAIKNIRYEFLPDKQLILYKEFKDSNTWINSDCITERYYFDTLNSRLSQIDYYNGGIGYSNKVIKRFDQDGFQYQENYECYNCGYDSNEEINKFNYTLSYQWTNQRDSVFLKYKYRTPNSIYDRFQDHMLSFVNELKRGKKNEGKPNPIFQSISNYSDQITKDEKGNIVKWLFFDNMIKNSFNVDNLYEYKYDEKDNLIQLTHSSLIHGGDHFKKDGFVPKEKYLISYPAYDKVGNWTIMKVLEAASGKSFVFHRNIKYY
ncbi:MAG: hypothetical protein WCP65_01475 [Bacteroidota bacterium]